MVQPETRRGPGGPRPGAGRKPLPPDERRRTRVMVNFTEQEHAELTEVAEGESVGGYIRELVLRHLARLRRRK